jgi:hypothetical protein
VTRLLDINDNQIAIGYSECWWSNSDHTIQQALVWDAQLGSRTIPRDQQLGVRDLNDLVAAPPNFIVDWATGINDAGWIVGIGHYGPGWGSSRGFVLRPLGSTGVGDVAIAVAGAPELRVLRNPVSDQLAVRFALPRAGDTRLSVFDVAGREVARVIDGGIPAGVHTAAWEPGVSQPAGVYYARLQAPGGVRSERFVLLR